MNKWLSLTVIGADMVEVDVHAATCLAMGELALPCIESVPGLEAYAIDRALNGHGTAGFDALCEAGAVGGDHDAAV
ncbi:MAG TPA: hypothetical protein VMU49_00450 [Candidatus Acidoferrales bacterium]|nr:hypothetical protein [Candidatus Acidoferrales bacterium]